jgi:AcrR family transcriptional regulator
MPTDAPRRRGRPPSGQREAILAATLELLRERGIAKLTTREVAARAGVSEASVYYHFGDRVGLLRAVFEAGLQPLEFINRPDIGGRDRRQVLTGAARALDRFFDQVIPVLMAAQSDPELRDALAAYMRERNLGPHRGVEALGGYLAAEQAAGRLDPDVDVEALALMLIGSCFTRVMQRHMLGQARNLPSLERVAAALDQLLG